MQFCKLIGAREQTSLDTGKRCGAIKQKEEKKDNASQALMPKLELGPKE